MTDYAFAYPAEGYRPRELTEECPRCGAGLGHHCSEYQESVRHRGAYQRFPVHPHLVPVEEGK